MRSILFATGAAILACGVGGAAVAADDNQAMAVVDKAIKAMGGEAKLKSAKIIAWKAKGKIRFGDNESSFTAQATAAGIDRYHSEFEGDFGGNSVKGVTVLDGDRGWRKFGDNSMELDKEGLANEKRTVYLQVVSATLMPLKGKDFRVEKADDEKVGEADAAGIKVTAPDGKDFTMYFDKSTHLPVKMVATVRGFDGNDFAQETIFAKYKEFDGIKKATKIEIKRDGQPFIDEEITDFKVLDKADSEAFQEPK